MSLRSTDDLMSIEKRINITPLLEVKGCKRCSSKLNIVELEQSAEDVEESVSIELTYEEDSTPCCSKKCNKISYAPPIRNFETRCV